MVFDGDDNWCRPLFHMKLILMFAELVLPTDKLNSHLPKISGFLARSVIVSIYIYVRICWSGEWDSKHPF